MERGCSYWQLTTDYWQLIFKDPPGHIRERALRRQPLGTLVPT